MVEVLTARVRLEPPYIIRKFGMGEEEFWEITDEDSRSELIDGVMIMHSPASVRHEVLFGFLYKLIGLYVEDRGLGILLGSQAPMHLAPGRIVCPDLMFISETRRQIVTDKKIEGSADLVIEIISESTRDYDLGEKKRLYREHGILECWYIDPEYQKITVVQKGREGYAEKEVRQGRVASAVIEGFWLKTEWLWEEPLPKICQCLEALKE